MLTKLITHIKAIRERAANVLTMNKRNLNYIYPSNRRPDFPCADNKLLTKKMFEDCDVTVPSTLVSYSSFYELSTLADDLACHKDFVIKPASGSGGGGILVFINKEAEHWITPSGKRFTLADIKKHITDIIFGVYSFGLSDDAIIEQRITQHPEITRLSPHGLADMRLIVYQHQPVMCMARIPTLASDGKANLHQGAIGLGIDIKSGVSQHAILIDSDISHHPDTNEALINQQIPHWDRVIEMSSIAARKAPLKYLGIDISISDSGPVLLEINVRPGLQIQNANQKGMRNMLEVTRLKGEQY